MSRLALRWSRGDRALGAALAEALADAPPVRADGRRAAYGVPLDGRRVWVKRFRVGSGGHPRREVWKARLGRAPADREWRALTALRAAGLPVPAPLALGTGADGDRWLAMEWIDGVPLAEALRAAAPLRRARLAALGAALARVHDAGWAHGDLHAGNVYLAPDGTPVWLDWQHARHSRSRAARLRDLARLEWSLVPTLSRADRLRLRAAALGVRPGDPAGRSALRAAGRALETRAHGHAASRTRDALRPGRIAASVRIGRARGLRVRTLPPDTLLELLVAHREALARGDARVLKDDVRSRVTAVATAGHRAVVKETPWRGLGRAVADLWRGSAGRRAWRAGHGLAARGLGAPRPWAWLETRRLGLATRSWVVLEDLRPAPAAAFALEAGLDADAVLDALASLLVALHRRGVDHGDLKGTHVLLAPGADGRPAPRLVDLEGVRFRRRLSETRRLRALAELNASLPDAFPAAARQRALRRYDRALPFACGSAAARSHIVRESLIRAHRWTGSDCPETMRSGTPTGRARR